MEKRTPFTIREKEAMFFVVIAVCLYIIGHKLENFYVAIIALGLLILSMIWNEKK